LVQLQALHASAGGNDIRHLTRAQLLKDGAPLRASKSKRTYRRVPTHPTFLHWFNKKWADEQEEGQPRRTREQYRQRMRACRGEYIEASRAERVQSVQHFKQKKERRRAGQASAKKTYKELIQNKLWGFSSQESPVTTQCLDRVFEHNSSVPPSARTTRGMRSFRQLRDEFCADCIIKDEAQVPPDMKFPLKLTCTQMCPGVCSGKLPSDVLLAAEALRRATDRWTAGTAFRLAATGEDGATYFSYKVWCFSDSSCVVLVDCMSDGSKFVLKDDDQVGVVFEVAHKELSNLWQKCGGTCTSLGGRGFRRNVPDVSESTLDETVLIPGALLA